MKVHRNLCGNNGKIHANEIAVKPEMLLGSAIIVGSGSDNNGNWIRWGNGWQECTFRTAQNSLTEITWEFPKPFSVAPDVQISPYRRAGDVFIMAHVGNTTQTNVTCYKEFKGNVNHGLVLKASGWWK